MARARQVTASSATVRPAKQAAESIDEVQTVTSEAVAEAQHAASEGLEEMAETMKQSATEATSQVEASQLQLKQGITKTMKTAEEVLAFGQANIEAFVKSGQIWSAGLQDISKQVASSAQASYEEAIAAFKALTTVKSLKEAVDLQVGLARSMMEKSVAESNKYTDASFKLAEQAIAPISGRVTLAVEKFGKPV